MRGFCDLHIHSNRSDGTYTPEELIAEAERIGLSAVALCDHNTIAGLPDFLKAAEGTHVRAVPGIEFSTDYEGTELHILGLFIQPEHYDAIHALLAEAHARKEASNLALAEALNEAGFPIDYSAVKSRTEGQPNRAHFAAELIQMGYVSSIREACLTILSPGYGLYQPPKRPEAFAVIRFIKSIGAAAVLAHPFLNLKEPQLRIFLEKAKACGLDGMETLYSTFDKHLTRRAREIAREFGLKESGGSDFHGRNKPDISLGTGRGNLAVPIEFLQKLETM